MKLFTLLSLASLVLLAACGPTPPETEETQEVEGSGETAVSENPAPSMEGELATLNDLPYDIALFVGPELAECTGEGPQICMMVKENPEDEYTYFYDQIDGFEYEEGYDYELTVLVTPVENPPADGSSLHYSLVEIVEKTAVESTETETTSIDGTAWQLDSYAIDGEMVETLPNTTFAFADGQMIGMTGCNNTGAGYTTDGNSITFGLGMSTMMFCGEAENGQEDAIRANLDAVATYKISGDTMEMMDADGNVILQFSVLEATTLTDTLWQATGINNGTGGVVSVLEETTITAVFGTDNTLSGNAGCNIYNTDYEASDGDMRINPSIITTRRACAEPITTQEGQYLTAIANATTYKIIGDKLELRDADGSLQVNYVAVPATPLVGTTWEATGLNNGTGGVVSTVSGSRITAVFNEDDTLNGDSGCNSYFGSYALAGDDGLTIGGLGSTMMACADNDVMAQEAAYNTALGTVATYSISDNKLELRTADGALAVSYTAAPVTPIAGSEWNVLSHNNGTGGVTTSIIGTQMTMNFDADGGVNGSAGCNNYFGSYEAGSELIAIGPIASTEMFCAEPEGVMDQEMEFLAALATVNSYIIDDSTMTMRDENNATAVVLQAKGYIDPAIMRILEKATYRSEFTEETTVTLTDGQYQTATVPDSASMMTVIFVDAAVGTIDDGYSAAVILATNGGGSGTFISLHLMQFEDGEAMEIAVTQLGDRTQINSVEINVDGEIVIDMVRHGADDPMCCPTEEVIVTYALIDEELVETAVVPTSAE